MGDVRGIRNIPQSPTGRVWGRGGVGADGGGGRAEVCRRKA